MPLILGTNSIKDTGYDVANSCRFNNPDDALMHRAVTTPTDVSKMTFSCWVKRSGLAIGEAQVILSCDTPASTHYAKLSFEDDDTLRFILQNSSGSYDYNLITSAKFRDPSAWMNIVVLYNSDDSTSGDRVKIFVNGTRVTAFGTAAYPSSAQDNGFLESSQTINVGGMYNSAAVEQHCDLYLAEVVFLDGVTKAATDFGEFDEDSPTIWKPKDVSGLSGEKGNNGFYLDFEDSANLGNDAFSGTDFTEVNLAATDQSTDTCTNNFATLNPLVNNAGQMMALTNGNLTGESTTSSAAWKTAVSTIGLTKGKWFWEMKFINVHNTYNNGVMGSNILVANATNPMNQTGWTGFYNVDGGEIRKDNAITTNDYGTYATNDIMSIALDVDNYTIAYYKNGSSLVSATALSTTGRDILFPASVYYQTNGGAQVSYNFGSPPYSESGGNSDADGYGNFSMAVPSGFFSINTKNLAEYG